jgi:mycothiol synthase
MSTLDWKPLTEGDLPALTHLAQCCLERDGGLPLLATEPMLRQLFLSGHSVGGRDETGELIAAAGAFLDASATRSVTALVHPSVRSQGIGEQLLKWWLAQAGGGPMRVVAETASPESDAFAARLGLERTFAEHVMRRPLVEVPRIVRPAEVHTYPWTADTQYLFHAAYSRSFANRPGFPDTPYAEWVRSVEEDEGFHPDLSRVALDEDGHVAGFVTISDNWIDQVGVVPEWRGQRLGAHLVVRSLRTLRKAGYEQAWLAVNVDNPSARALYRSLGFLDSGVRARYQQVGPSRARTSSPAYPRGYAGLMSPVVLLLAVLVGMALGLLGGGGSILTVPLLVYIAGLDAKEAIATSLLVVGVTSLAALVPHARAGRVRWRTGAIFGAAAMAGAYAGGRIAEFIPGTVLLVAFALMMVATAVAMIRGRARQDAAGPGSGSAAGDAGGSASVRELPVKLVLLEGVVVGLVTGLVGAGGGFLVVPALVLLGGLPMPVAVGTSLLVIAMKSFAGLAGYLSSVSIDWGLAAAVTAMAVLGSIGGALLSGRVPQDRLRQGFGWFVLVMGVLVLGQSALTS